MAKLARRRLNGFQPSSGEHRIDTGDRRKAFRLASAMAVLVQAPGCEIVGIASDIGLGGLFVETDQTLAYASEVTVLLGRHDVGIELRLPATVRWTSARGFGLQFGALGARETRALVLLLTMP